ncbi:SAV2148 family HEPN domain-containing protein [Streptomyces sp. NPDC050448]|uniref:SAV2148 family HEPN domain-containing protein n=1 Tax=Streptomyces sp. NPDC050448 TaxID=3155404 RepID=UPI003425ADE8
MSSGGLELPPGDSGHEGGPADAPGGAPGGAPDGVPTGVPAGAVSLAPTAAGSVRAGAELDWGADAWSEVRTRAQRAGRAYIWLNLIEQRLRAVVGAVLRPIYEPVHGGDDWVVAAAGPAGQEWVQRAVAVREVSRRKGYLLDPADDNVLSFLTLPQLRELMVQHWPCFEPYFDDRREIELALDELEVTRNVVSRNRALSRAVLEQAERASARLLEVLGGGAGSPAADRLPIDAVEDLVGDRYADVISVHPDRVRLQRQLPAEDLFGGARRLDAIGIGLNLLVQNFSGRRLVRLTEAGCRVRLLFLNPASSAVKRRERELGLRKGELSRSVEMNILHVRRVRAGLRDPSRFEIHVFDETPRFTAYLVEGESSGIAVVQSYLRRARGMEAPVLVLRGGGTRGSSRDAENGLFPTYREEFESIWQDSRPVS